MQPHRLWPCPTRTIEDGVRQFEVWRDKVIHSIKDTVLRQLAIASETALPDEVVEGLVAALVEREQEIACAMYAIGKYFGIDGRDLGHVFSECGLDATQPHGSRPGRIFAGEWVPRTLHRAE